MRSFLLALVLALYLACCKITMEYDRPRNYLRQITPPIMVGLAMVLLYAALRALGWVD